MVVSCAKNAAEADLPIKQETMAHIIFDMQKAKAIVAVVKDTLASDQTRLQDFRKGILQKYNVNQADFDKTWDYYLNHSSAMDSLLLKLSLISEK